MERPSRDEVTRLVVTAWAEVPYPGDHDIADERGCDSEMRRVAEFFRGRHWSEIDLHVLAGYVGDASACLAFMNPAAFRYFLAAYMLIALTAYEQADVVGDAAAQALEPSQNPALRNWEAERFAGTSIAQRQAIVAFLHYMSAHHADSVPGDLHRSLDYWRRAG